MTRNAIEVFVFPGVFDEAGFAQPLTGLTAKIISSNAKRPFTLLDCHDQSLGASGRILIESGGMLQLIRDDGQIRVQKTQGSGRFVVDLPSGPVRDALRGFPALRALMGIAAGVVEEKSLTILDDVQKTQVRGTLIHLTCDVGQVTIVRLQRLRGYDRAFNIVCAAMAQMTAKPNGLEAVFTGLCPGVEPYRAKPEIKLGKTEPSIDVAADIIGTYLRVARQNDDGIIADIDTEFLHDYRVSLRRIRSVLSLFKGVLSDRQTTELKRAFSDLMAPTGQTRDFDVYLLEKEKYFNLLPSNLHSGVQAMFDQFEKERERELSRLTRHLRSAGYKKTMTDLTDLFDGTVRLEPGPNAHHGALDYACTLIWNRYRKVCKLARGITDETPDLVVHDLRIDCKKLRYLMEFFAPLFDKKDFKTILKPLKMLQDNLGLFNDYSVQQEALLNFVSQQNDDQGRVDTQLGLAVGGLIAVLDHRQTVERGRVIDNFQQFDGPDIRRLFRNLFHHKKG